MGLFSFFNKKTKKEIIEGEVKPYDIGGYTIEIPKSWKTYNENFRHKARNKSESIELSVNIEKIDIELPKNKKIENKDILIQMITPLINSFIKEGGYLPQEEVKFEKDYAYCSFLVENRENHFHSWYLQKRKEEYYLYDQILKQDGNWNANNKQLHFNILNSLKQK